MVRLIPLLLLCLFAAAATLQAAGNREHGAALYAELCADCHGPLASTDKPNRPFGRLASAIRIVPSMYHLKRLTREELQAIVEATTQPDR